jgi:hypothetical protein
LRAAIVQQCHRHARLHVLGEHARIAVVVVAVRRDDERAFATRQLDANLVGRWRALLAIVANSEASEQLIDRLLAAHQV